MGVNYIAVEVDTNLLITFCFLCKSKSKLQLLCLDIQSFQLLLCSQLDLDTQILVITENCGQMQHQQL